MLHKNERITTIIIALVILIQQVGCKNKYENAIIGDYRIDTYELIDSAYSIKVPTLDLKLLSDRTFVLKNDTKVLQGTWEAGDNGDRTWIKLTFGSITSDCAVSGKNLEFIDIWNPQDFYCPFLKSLTLVRQ